MRISAVFSLLAVGIASFAPAAENTTLTVNQTPDTIWIRAGERPLLEYRFGNVPYKPYVKQWFTPGGVNILRDSPSDHKHHHAMMYAVGVDGINFWEEAGNPGKQLHRGFDRVGTFARPEAAEAGFTERLDWVAADGRLLLRERRTLKALMGEMPDASVLIWKSRFTPPGRDVELTGRHYFGLGLRFVESMDRVGQFLSADGKPGETVRGTERLVPARWIAYTAPVEGKPVTVALFDHPANPRFPAGKFTMTQPFSYMSATLDLKAKPLPLKADATLDLRYAVVLWQRETKPAEVEAFYRRWVETLAGKERNP